MMSSGPGQGLGGDSDGPPGRMQAPFRLSGTPWPGRACARHGGSLAGRRPKAGVRRRAEAGLGAWPIPARTVPGMTDGGRNGSGRDGPIGSWAAAKSMPDPAQGLPLLAPVCRSRGCRAMLCLGFQVLIGISFRRSVLWVLHHSIIEWCSSYRVSIGMLTLREIFEPRACESGVTL